MEEATGRQKRLEQSQELLQRFKKATNRSRFAFLLVLFSCGGCVCDRMEETLQQAGGRAKQLKSSAAKSSSRFLRIAKSNGMGLSIEKTSA